MFCVFPQNYFDLITNLVQLQHNLVKYTTMASAIFKQLSKLICCVDG